MWNKRLLCSCILVISCLFISPATVHGEEQSGGSLKLEELIVQVLPEYSHHPNDQNEDHSPLLVGYQGTFRNTSNEWRNGKINFLLPVNEENFKIGPVGYYSNNGKEIFEIDDYAFDKETGIISLETKEAIEPNGIYKVIIEFYTNSINEHKGKKRLEYTFRSLTDIERLHFVFIEPLKTDRFIMEPAPDSQQKNSFNMSMFSYMYKKIKAGDEKLFKVEYERDEKRTTKEIMEAMASSGHSHSSVQINEKIPGWKIAATMAGITFPGAIILLIILWKRSGKETKVKNEDSESLRKRELKKKRLRSMLSEGRMTEEEYQQLINKLEGQKHDEQE